MVHSVISWHFYATRSASSVVIRDRCIWPSLSERLPLPSLVPRIRRETVPIACVTALSTLLPSTSCCAARLRKPPTDQAIKPLHPFWKLTSIPCSTPFAGRWRFAAERGRQFFRALARATWLPACGSSSLFFPAHTS